MIEHVKEKVNELLNKDNSGHGMEHINRVLNLSLKFAKKEKGNEIIVSLIALLHDVDDYKLFGMDNAENLTNAKRIMRECNVDESIQEQVRSALNNIGYSKRLKGCIPTTLEGKIVSDADMCDALGANGIIRVYTYSMKNGKPFFNKNIFPIEDMTAEKYTSKCADSSVCHLFEKILKLKDLMLTESGKEEAKNRHQIIVDFLYHLFDEENVPEWTDYLNEFLNR
ncbi:MAG: HD domain-containing protein [Bacilli bacterium]|nr:HD domain-containing protein [Bacilli bacterium]